MDTFNFPYHTVRTQYPAAGDTMQFGNSYQFDAAPRAPQQRLFILAFPGMKLFVQSDGVTVDTTTSTTFNMRVFELFYEAHGTWTNFIYPHPVLGNITVRFSEPIACPEPIPGGNGTTAAFEIKLREQP